MFDHWTSVGCSSTLTRIEANPGLRSRFPTAIEFGERDSGATRDKATYTHQAPLPVDLIPVTTSPFEDHTSEELLEIAAACCCRRVHGR